MASLLSREDPATNAQRIIRLLTVAETVRKVISLPRSLLDQQFFDQTLALARQHLAPEVFAAASQIDAQVSPDSIYDIAFELSNLDSLGSEPCKRVALGSI